MPPLPCDATISHPKYLVRFTFQIRLIEMNWVEDGQRKKDIVRCESTATCLYKSTAPKSNFRVSRKRGEFKRSRESCNDLLGDVQRCKSECKRPHSVTKAVRTVRLQYCSSCFFKLLSRSVAELVASFSRFEELAENAP